MGMFSPISIDRRWLPDAPPWLDAKDMQTKSLNVWRKYEVDSDGVVYLIHDGDRIPTSETTSIDAYSGAKLPALPGFFHSEWYEVTLLVHKGRVIAHEVLINRPKPVKCSGEGCKTCVDEVL